MIINFSTHYGMSINGHADIDFVDIPINTDVELYIDPERIAASSHPFAADANAYIEDFFNTLCASAIAGDRDAVHNLLSFGHEPNETHMGYSRDASRGRGVSADILEPIIDEIFKRDLFANNLINALGDLSVFTPNFGADRLSDLCVNIIREPLFLFTHRQLGLWHLGGTMVTVEMPVWNRRVHCWEYKNLDLPAAIRSPILLCPKDFVGTSMLLTPGAFLQKKVLGYRQQVLLDEGSPLCRKRDLKNGRYEILPPTKKDIREYEMGDMTSKDYLRLNALNHPELLSQYRRDLNRTASHLTDDELDCLLYAS